MKIVPLEQAFYLLGVLLITPVWFYIFIRNKRSREEMLLVGLCLGLGAVLIGKYYALADYWSPPYIFGPFFNIEDFLYGFFYGGIASELFEAIFHYENSDRQLRYHNLAFFLSIFGVALSFPIIVNLLGFNSIVAHIIPPLLIGLYTVLRRIDLLFGSLVNALLLAIFTFLWFEILYLVFPNVVQDFWMLENLSGIFILHFPIEEYLFAISLGFGVANFHEFLTGKTLRKVRIKNL